LSIATKIQVRWSGLLFGIMMFIFVATLHFPGALASPRDRFAWTVVIREMSFAGGGWILAGNAMRGEHKSRLVTVGRVLIGIAAIFFGVEHFLHPMACPGVPLEKLMPAWIPGRLLIGYLTGAILLVAGVGILLGKKTRMAATYLGTWIVLLVLFIYGPILIVSLADPSTAVKVEGINYFADTLLFGGAILALASATPRTDESRACPPVRKSQPRKCRYEGGRLVVHVRALGGVCMMRRRFFYDLHFKTHGDGFGRKAGGVVAGLVTEDAVHHVFSGDDRMQGMHSDCDRKVSAIYA
jgi:uncharacterized membrane protein